MEEKIITLAIEKLAGLGDGAGRFDGRPVFIPYTLAGDVVQARITHQTKDAVHATLEALITPAANRITPVCKHFADCGSCTLQHINGEGYRNFKEQMARQAIHKAGFDPAIMSPLTIMPARSRRRAELKMKEGRLGYYAQRSHRLVDIEECKVLEPALEALVRELKAQLAKVRGLTGVQINGVDGGYDVLLFAEEEASFMPSVRAPGMLRMSIQRGDKLSTSSQEAPVTVTFGGIQVAPPPGAFLQASLEAQGLMTRFALEATEGAPKVLDLFAGLGTYSFPLAQQAEVTAVEGDAPMVKAMQETARRHGLKTLKAETRNLFTRAIVPSELKRYDAVVINPPRLGAKEQSAALAASEVKKLVMISCNPATFARDARLLKEGGYRLVRVLPVDQFIYSSHLEILAEFAR